MVRCKPVTIEMRCENGQVSGLVKSLSNWECEILEAKKVARKFYGDRHVPGKSGKLVVYFPSISEKNRAMNGLGFKEEDGLYMAEDGVLA